MMKSENRLLFAALLLGLALPACTSVKNELGVGRNSPDEFLVVKRAPLTLPPEYTLRPPANSGEVPSSQAAAAVAKTALLGKPATSVARGTVENALLQKLGADSADPDIRKVIDEENGFISLTNRTVADKLIFWNDEASASDDFPASIVDSKAEAERLKQNKAEGKPANAGEVPVIEKKKGTIDRIF